MDNFKEETRIFTSMADSNGLRNMAHEINAFVKEGRDVKVEYHNIITKDYGHCDCDSNYTRKDPDHVVCVSKLDIFL